MGHAPLRLVQLDESVRAIGPGDKVAVRSDVRGELIERVEAEVDVDLASMLLDDVEGEEVSKEGIDAEGHLRPAKRADRVAQGQGRSGQR